MRLKTPFEITRFPLFLNVNKNLFCLKYEQRAQSFKIFLAELRKRRVQEICSVCKPAVKIHKNTSKGDHIQ